MERFAVIGLGNFGMTLATLLAEAGAEVIAVDRDRALVEEIRDKVALAVALDSTDEQAIRSQGIDKVNVAVVGIGANFEGNILTTVLLKRIGVPRVISRATNPIRKQVLLQVGAEVINPEEESAQRWRNKLMAPKMMKERIELAEGYSLAEASAPPSFHQKTLKELDVRKRYKVNVVAIRRSVEEQDESGAKRTRQVVVSVPGPDSVIEPGDVLFLIGSDEALNSLPRR